MEEIANGLVRSAVVLSPLARATAAADAAHDKCAAIVIAGVLGIKLFVGGVPLKAIDPANQLAQVLLPCEHILPVLEHGSQHHLVSEWNHLEKGAVETGTVMSFVLSGDDGSHVAVMSGAAAFPAAVPASDDVAL